MMRFSLLPLLAAAISVGSLHADSIVTTTNLVGSVLGQCSGTTYCSSGDPTTGPYADASLTQSSYENTIRYLAEMNFNPAGDAWVQGDVMGTIDLPANWTQVHISTVSTSNAVGGEISAEIFLEASFDPTHTRVPSQGATYALDPTVPNTITLTDDAEGSLTNTYLDYTITLTGTPAETPEPASLGFVGFPLLALGIAKWRRKK